MASTLRAVGIEGISDGDRKKLFFAHISGIGKINDEIEALQKQAKTARSLAKADGFSLTDEINLGLKLRKAEDDAHIAASIARQLGIARYYGLQVNVQLNLFDEVFSKGENKGRDSLEKAHEDGFLAGLLAKNRSEAGGYTGAESEAWLAGYDAGQKSNRDAMFNAGKIREAAVAADAKAATAAPKKRGRPPGSPNKPKGPGAVAPAKANVSGTKGANAAAPQPPAGEALPEGAEGAAAEGDEQGGVVTPFPRGGAGDRPARTH